MKTLAFISIAAMFTAPALATQETGEDAQVSEPEIVVQAPVGSYERRVQLREMVSDLINEPRDGRPVASYFDAICPIVRGLPEGETRVIEERMRENAEALGANRRNPSTPCTANVEVVFLNASSGSPEEWVTADNDMLGHLLSFQRAEVLYEHDPVRAWTYNEDRSAIGTPLPNSYGYGLRGELPIANRTRSVSRFTMDSTVEITLSVLFIELASAQGKTLQQLADYASLRTFGNSRGLAEGAIPAAPTILTLFRDEDAPEGLTNFDRAMISALYSTSRRSKPRRFYSNIASRAFEMEKDEREGRP